MALSLESKGDFYLWTLSNQHSYMFFIFVFFLLNLFLNYLILHGGNCNKNRVKTLFEFGFYFEVLQPCFRGALSGLRQFFASESPLKMMKSAFYFILKALFILKIFKFLSWLFSHVQYKKGLIRKMRLISKFMTSQPGKQTVAAHILSNISRSKERSDNRIWSVNRI